MFSLRDSVGPPGNGSTTTKGTSGRFAFIFGSSDDSGVEGERWAAPVRQVKMNLVKKYNKIIDIIYMYLKINLFTS